MKPISKARCSSVSMNDGTSTLSGVSPSSSAGRFGSASTNVAITSVSTRAVMKIRNGSMISGNAASCSIAPSSKGCTPCAQEAANTGSMTKYVRNSAKLTIIMFGGACCRPTAVRKIDSTVTMNGKQVTITAIAGARLSTVTSKNI